jgi:hypothetical protein
VKPTTHQLLESPETNPSSSDSELSLTSKPEVILELLSALPANLPREQQRRIIQNVLERKTAFDAETLLGELAWQKRDLVSLLEGLAEEEEAEQAAITAEIDVLWNRRDAVQEKYTHKSDALYARVAQLDRILSFLTGEELITAPRKNEPEPFLRLAA